MRLIYQNRLAGPVLGAVLVTGISAASASTAPDILCPPEGALIMQSAPTASDPTGAWPGEGNTYVVQAHDASHRGRLDVNDGMAVAVSRDGDDCVLLTADHVVNGRAVKISPIGGGKQFDARIDEHDKDLDVARLTVKGMGDGCRPVDKLQTYPAIGTPLSVSYFPMSSHVRTAGKVATYSAVADHGLSIVADFDVAHGASGTGAFAPDGSLVGLVYAHISKQGKEQAFITPICRIISHVDVPREPLPPLPRDELEHLGVLTLNLFNKGDWDRLILITTDVIQRNPTTAWAYYRRSAAYTYKKAFGQGISDAEKAVAIDPKDPAAYADLAFAFSGKGDHEKAEELYRKSCDLHEQDMCAYVDGLKASTPSSNTEEPGTGLQPQTGTSVEVKSPEIQWLPSAR